jgi:hypothetical protein
MSQVLNLGWGLLPASSENNETQNSHISANFVVAPEAASFYSANNENDKAQQSSLFQSQQQYVYQQPNYANLQQSKNGYSVKGMEQNYVIGQPPMQLQSGYAYGQQVMQPSYMDGSYDPQQYQQALNTQQFMAAQQNVLANQSEKSNEKGRDADERPLVRLSVNLIHTYKNINEVSCSAGVIKGILELLQPQDPKKARGTSSRCSQQVGASESSPAASFTDN